MTKRPRLSQNLRPPHAERRDTASELPSVEIDVPRPEGQVSQAQTIVLPPPAPDPTIPLAPGRQADTLPQIFEDAILALSFASTFAWTQGLMLQLRLSNHFMGLPGDNRPSR